MVQTVPGKYKKKQKYKERRTKIRKERRKEEERGRQSIFKGRQRAGGKAADER